MMKIAGTTFLTRTPLTTKQVVIRILCIELLMEFFIMLMFSVLPFQFSTVTGAFADAILLVVLTTPAIYFWVIKPFVEARDEAIVHINHLAHSDPLTKLANRRLIMEYLEVLVAANARSKEFGAVLLIDLDDFQPINDKYGHDAGDELLIKTGERLKNSVRGEDVVGRLGGDKFIVLLRKLGTEDKNARYVAQFVAYKLIKQVIEPVNFNDNFLQAGASVGIRLFSAETDVFKIISDAESTMYRAKENGKGCAVFFDE
jgi:diguanylate cyclase (GGDEF)-like protein